MHLKFLSLTALLAQLSLIRADAIISANNIDGAGGVELAFRKEADGVELKDRRWMSTLSWGPVPTDKDTAPGQFIVKTADEAARCEIHGRGGGQPQNFRFKSVKVDQGGKSMKTIQLDLCGCYGNHWISCNIIGSGMLVECDPTLVNHEQKVCP